MEKNDLVFYLFRDKGVILFSSELEGKELFWLTFLSGGHSDWIYYIQISKEEFFGVWFNRLTLKELLSRYSHIRMNSSESLEVESKYKLLSFGSLHHLPSALEQMRFKSQVDSNGNPVVDEDLKHDESLRNATNRGNRISFWLIALIVFIITIVWF